MTGRSTRSTSENSDRRRAFVRLVIQGIRTVTPRGCCLVDLHSPTKRRLPGKAGRPTVGVLEALFSWCGTPACLESDKGPELSARQLTACFLSEWLTPLSLKPSSPWRKGHQERSMASCETAPLVGLVFRAASPRYHRSMAA